MPYPPEKMEEMFRILTRPSIEAALGKAAVRPPEEAASNPKGNDDSATSFYNLFIDPFCCPGR